MIRMLYAVEKQARDVSVGERLALRQAEIGPRAGANTPEASSLERAVTAEASHGRGHQLRPEPMAGNERVLL